MRIDWDDSALSSIWINPSGLSGREIVFDTTGIRLHWLEIII